jgi:hypothetical protein
MVQGLVNQLLEEAAKQATQKGASEICTIIVNHQCPGKMVINNYVNDGVFSMG